ncbi:MAG: YkgJ family cysteine cluster protein, partial [Myxococcales bacterium]|nr:YkgJ family cysteine cluster protein [Myxococcales bacterium]
MRKVSSTDGRSAIQIADGLRVVAQPDGSHLLGFDGDAKTARVPAAAIGAFLLVDGTRSIEEVEQTLASRGAPVPPGALETLITQLSDAGFLTQVSAAWAPLETLAWPEHRCEGCGACCQGHWIGPLEPDFVRETTARMPLLRDKYPRLKGEQPFVRLEAGAPRLFLNSSSGQCVFLGEDKLCILHREFGATGKPSICQMFPHV